MKTKLLGTPMYLGGRLMGLCLLCFVMFEVRGSDLAANKSIEDMYVTVELENGSLEEVFTSISNQTDLNFQYGQDVALERSVRTKTSQGSLGSYLREVAQETQLSFKRFNETIHVQDAAGSEGYVSESFGAADIAITGKVTAEDTKDGLPGVNVIIKGTSTGAVTDIDGNYRIVVPSENSVLVFSFIGYENYEVRVGSQTVINVLLPLDIESLEEVIIVGYGEQKKETVVGAITQTDETVLKRSAGIPNLSTALTGNLPGLITSASTGLPGEESPQIVIRGQNSWNGSQPLILVDGVERPEFFNVMDISSVEAISVLKDASATAVFGSRGANGVIIITTKRGVEGRAEITGTVNTTFKVVSKLPGKKDSYESILLRNRAIEYELANNPASWNDIIPMEIADKYRNPANAEEAERYPNIDWQEALFKDFAMAYNANVGIRGGTEKTKYFANIDYQNEGDLFRDVNNNRGYDPGFSYNRLNFRSNLDFQLTPTTKLSTNLGGTYAVRKSPWGSDGDDYPYWIAAYSNSPDAFIPQYSDGIWGYHNPNVQGALNSVRILAISGVEYRTTAKILTNFVLDQDLSFLLKGLSVKGTLAVDNSFLEHERGVNDLYNDIQEKWIDPETGQVFYERAFDANSRFDFYDQGASWSPAAGSIDEWQSQRKLFYQFQLNYAQTFGQKHDVTAMGLMNRQEEAWGSVIPTYREDWVFRTTYSYDGKYMLDYSGAYNGSEKFGVDYRFHYFHAGGLGWMLSEESFMKSLTFINMLKLRASYGEVGDDSIGERFLFMDEWNYGDNSKLGSTGWQSEFSPYTWYVQQRVGNPSVRWETVYKYNVGADFGLFNGLIDGSVDFFRDNRQDILMIDGRAIPVYFGADPPAANIGEVTTEGFEIAVGFDHSFGKNFRVWADFAMTHAKDNVIERDSPELLDDYQKNEGFQLGQARTPISSGYYNTWDDLYASTPHGTNDLAKIPGNYHILDFNGDGIIDSFDSAPYGFAGVPQNTFNTTVGFEWKGLSCFVQFYGVSNVTRQVVFNSLAGQLNRVYEEGSYWSMDNTNADTPMPRWLSTPSGSNSGSRYFYDGSYLRLKNAEIAYRFDSDWVNKMGMQSLRLYVNGNNLLLWTKMPDDRESNFAGTGWASQGAYPTVKRINLGLNVTF